MSWEGGKTERSTKDPNPLSSGHAQWRQSLNLSHWGVSMPKSLIRLTCSVPFLDVRCPCRLFGAPQHTHASAKALFLTTSSSLAVWWDEVQIPGAGESRHSVWDCNPRQKRGIGSRSLAYWRLEISKVPILSLTFRGSSVSSTRS